MAIAAGVLVGALLTLRLYCAIAAGYKAKVLCSSVFGSGRVLDPQRADQISADSYWLLRPFGALVDHQARTVTASLFGFRPRRAVHRDGLGATLLAGVRRLAEPEWSTDRPGIDDATAARHRAAPDWPTRTATSVVQRIVDAAFDEPSPTRLRRTYAVVVVQDGHVVAERYASGIGANTPMPGWSMAKSVLSALVGILVHQGKLSLDDRELLPGWRRPDPRAAITLEDLLRMRSGLAFSEVYGNPWSDVLRMLYSCHDTAAYAASRRLAATPGSVWSYSSGTTNILSAIVRRAIGEPGYHDWPRRVLFDPLGMRSAVMEPDSAGTFVCSSSMLATARDWARFGQLWLDEGRWNGREILPRSWVRFSTTPTPESPDGRYGAHWWLKLNPEIGGDDPSARSIAPDAFFAIGHEGQTLSVIPSKRLVAVRLGASIHIDAWNQARFLSALQAAL